jgi:hypothetical protein
MGVLRTSNGVAVQAAVFPGAMCRHSLVAGAGVSGPPIAVGKKLSPHRGDRGANLKHRARNAEVSAESRLTTQFASGS